MHLPYAPEVDRILMQPVPAQDAGQPRETDALAEAA
jgi:hypothetical protein